jgi:hypothetical protein
MLFGSAALERKDAATRATGSSPVSIYPSDLLPQLPKLPAALADIETRYEMERERLEQGSGTEDEKQRLRAELETVWQRDREPIARRLAQLQSPMRPRTEWP